MIDVSVLKAGYSSEKSTTASLKSLHTHAETIKGRKLIMARYLNIGNPQDYSQVRTLSQRYHDRDRERNLNIAGENTFAAGKESKLEWLRQRAAQERKMSKELTKPTSKSLERIPVDIGDRRLQKIQFHQVVPQREAIVKTMERTSSVTILRKRVKRENSANGELPDEMDRIEEVVSIVDGGNELESSILKGRSHTEGSQRIRRSNTSLASLEKKVAFTRDYLESQTLPPLFTEAKPAAISMNLSKLVKTKKIMTKFTKKFKDKKKIDLDAEAPFTRFQRLTHKEPERPKGERVRLWNPLHAVCEHLKFQDFYEASPKKSLKPKNFLEHVETSEDWDALGEVDGVQTDEKLDYQMGFTKFDVTDHFNLDDFGILEWRIRSENGSVRKVYHKKSLRIFALRTVNLERFNNDPTDLKNELRTLSILTQHPHRNIIRMISSRMKVSSEGSPSTSLRKLSDYQAYNMNGRNEFIAMEVGIVSEFGIGNLKEITKLKKKLGQTWSETELLILVRETSAALAHCESLGIAHRNVKPSNIFFGEDKATMKLVDYKLSLFLEKSRKTVETNIVGTPRYMSYELKKVYLELKTNKRKQISVKYDPFLSDVSSLALVILELMLISMNIDKDTRLEAELADSILSETKEVYPYLSKILGGMLSTDLKMRPRFAEIAKLLKLPSDIHRTEVYENRYNLLTQIDDSKREWGLRDGNEGEDVDGLMLSAKIYYQLTMTEIRQCVAEQANTKTLQNTLPSVKSNNNKFTRSLKTMKKSLPNNKLNQVATEATPLTTEELLKKEFLYKEMTIEFLYSCYEEYMKKEDFDNAISVCNYMREVYKFLDKNEEMKIFIFIFSSLGYLSFASSRLTESLEFFTQANTVAKKHYGDDNLSTSITLNNLANLYFEIGNFPKAKELYQRNLKVKETIGLRKELPYAISAYNLANVHHLGAEIAAAENYYNQSMTIYKQHLEKVPEEVGHGYLALAIFNYSCLKNREKGQQFLDSAIDCFERVQGEQKKNFLMGLANHHLGILHYCYRELTQAITAYDEAVGFLESSLFKQDNLVSKIRDHQKRAEIEFFEEINNPNKE